MRSICSPIATACTFVLALHAGADKAELRQIELPNGVRAVIVQAPQAGRQFTFTFLPLTMANDEPGRAQWAHLIEHMLIRSTDPHSLMAEGMQLNGETTHGGLRLETNAEPGHWRAALGRHAKWLTARAFDGETLAREIGHIGEEEAGTAANGFTSKFAIAAWNQIIRHGREHAAVSGDVKAARLEDVQAYAAAHVPIGKDVLIATVGPTDAAQVEAALRELIGAIKPVEVPPTAPAMDPRFEGSHEATWDFPTRHVLLWWKLPDRSPDTLAAATGAGHAFLALQAPEKLGQNELYRRLVAYPAVQTPEGSFFIVDVCLTDGAVPEAFLTRVQEFIGKLQKGEARHPAITGMAKLLSFQTAADADFETIRAQTMEAQWPVAEGIWLLGVVNIAYDWGIDPAQLKPALANVSSEAVEEIAALLKTQPGMLVLRPKP